MSESAEKKKVVEGSLWFVRVAALEGYEDNIRKLSHNEQTVSMLCVKHKADPKDPHEHYHFAIHRTKTRMDAFRNYLKKDIGLDKGKGNAHMSIKPWDGSPRCLSYMFHEEGAPIIVNKGYSDDQLKQFKESNDEIQETKLSNRKKSIVEQVIYICQTTEHHVTSRFIFETYIRIMKKERYIYPGHHRMKNIIDTIALQIGGDEFIEKLFSDYCYITRN